MSTILLVDDSAENIQTLAACLRNEYQLKVANNGSQCLELASRFQPDLILLDIEMPDMNGFDVCQQLKSNEHTKTIPVIFVSGHTSQESEERGLETGAVDYIFKPVRPAIVKARVRTHVTLKQQHDRLIDLAMRDQLTGLFNRHYLMEHIYQRLSRSQRHGYDMAALMLDIDHFKRINDDLGHQIGDQVLKELGHFLQDFFRTEDMVARLGGEEFLVILDPCPAKQIMAKAEQLRLAIAELEPANVKVTVSIGATAIADEDTLKTMLNRADHALYQAKDQGRNQVCIQ